MRRIRLTVLPFDFAFLPDVTMTQNRLGRLYVTTGQFRKSIEAYGEAFGIYSELADENPNAYNQYLYKTAQKIRPLYQAMGRPEDFEKEQPEAYELLEKVRKAQK